MSTRHVMVDDADAAIQYGGQWFADVGDPTDDGTGGHTFLRTQHRTTTSSSLSFPFRGSSVDVLGTLDTLDSLGMDPKWECFIDGISIGPTSYPTPAKRNNQDLCHSGDIPGGDHVLRLDVTTRGSTFWIDVITYVPLLDVPLDSAVIKVPVTDPAIRFSPEWQPSDAGRKTQTAGSKMAFSFIGRS